MTSCMRVFMVKRGQLDRFTPRPCNIWTFLFMSSSLDLVIAARFYASTQGHYAQTTSDWSSDLALFQALESKQLEIIPQHLTAQIQPCYQSSSFFNNPRSLLLWTFLTETILFRRVQWATIWYCIVYYERFRNHSFFHFALKFHIAK